MTKSFKFFVKSIFASLFFTLFSVSSTFAIVEVGADYFISSSIDGEITTANGKITAEDDGISGYGVYGVFLGFGLGVDSIEANIEAEDSASSLKVESKYDITLFNLFYRIPLPIIDIDLGLLAGTADINSKSTAPGRSSAKNSSGGGLGFLARGSLGVFGPLGITLSYRYVKVGKAEEDGLDTQIDELDLTSYGIGFDFGF